MCERFDHSCGFECVETAAQKFNERLYSSKNRDEGERDVFRDCHLSNGDDKSLKKNHLLSPYKANKYISPLKKKWMETKFLLINKSCQNLFAAGKGLIIIPSLHPNTPSVVTSNVKTRLLQFFSAFSIISSTRVATDLLILAEEWRLSDSGVGFLPIVDFMAVPSLSATMGKIGRVGSGIAVCTCVVSGRGCYCHAPGKVFQVIEP